MNHPLGHISYWVERTRGRMSWIGTASSLAAAIKLYNLSWWWVMGLIPIAAVSIWIDRKHVAPGEVEAATVINPQWQRLIKMVEEIKDRK